jgi:hypothetical protein
MALKVERTPGSTMAGDGAIGFAILKLAGGSAELACDVVKDALPSIVLSVRSAAHAGELVAGAQGALIEVRMGQTVARAGSVASVADGTVVFVVEAGPSFAGVLTTRLTDCQLPAMYRSRSEEGLFGAWRGAIITKHSPNRLHMQVEEGHVVPFESELMFVPIGSDTGSQGRLYGEEGGVINAADVRSRRIRVRAVTLDVLPSESGTVTLVVDISRTLYRAA